MPALFVYITAADEAEAASLGRMLVTRRLASCANLLGPIRSLYWWDGAVQDEAEAVLVAKTWDDRLDELVAAVREAHSYDEPCVVALPVAGGSPTFLDWIRAETRPR
ncbi:divalent-cation tolerance protein CutA [Desulfocurvus sp. DL9XJH121]